MQAIDCVGFTLIIDDIVRPDGTTYMQQLGGGGQSLLAPPATAVAANKHPGCFPTTLDRPRPNPSTGPQTMLGYQLVSKCLGQTAKLGLAAGVGADIPAVGKVRRVATL